MKCPYDNENCYCGPCKECTVDDPEARESRCEDCHGIDPWKFCSARKEGTK